MKKKAIIAFVPVIHKGYVDFFSKHKGDIYIFDQKLINSFVHLTRDLRVMDPKKTILALEALLKKQKTKKQKNVLTRKIDLANEKTLKMINNQNADVIMPEDEVCHVVAEKYLTNCKVTYVSVFLRWNRLITLTEHQIPSHRKVTKDDFHKSYIQEAEKEVVKSSDWWRQIASVLVKDGQIVFKSHNHHLPSDHHLATFGDPRSNFDAGQHPEIYTSIHSEAAAIAEAAHKGVSLNGAILYVTTFPCANCARLLVKAGVKKVYYSKGYSLLDAEKILDHFGVEVFLVQ
jgi:dCMP deaminase